jgi:2-(1,2-epoxy-1,2-dihydrophenyl)acetyl-CoA isomerase
MSDPVLLSIDGAIATVTLNRPDRLNALDISMATALRDVMLTVERDESVRVVVLSGAGKGFMAGGDVQLFHEQLGNNLDRQMLDMTLGMHDAVISMHRMPKPVIASVHGPCAGAGFSIAMACDMVMAADNAVFTLAYSMIGASPDGSSSYFLPRLVGRHKALELIMLSDRLDSAKAAELGLVNFVVPADELEAETAKLVGRLAQGPTQSYAKTKTLVNRSLQSGIADQLDAEAQMIAASSHTEDFAEGITAFAEKRKPDFKGR